MRVSERLGRRVVAEVAAREHVGRVLARGAAQGARRRKRRQAVLVADVVEQHEHAALRARRVGPRRRPGRAAGTTASATRRSSVLRRIFRIPGTSSSGAQAPIRAFALHRILVSEDAAATPSSRFASRREQGLACEACRPTQTRSGACACSWSRTTTPTARSSRCCCSTSATTWTSVADGAAALTALAAASYDAVLMDCHMPVLDGFAATVGDPRRRGRRRPHPDHRPDRPRRAPALRRGRNGRSSSRSRSRSATSPPCSSARRRRRRTSFAGVLDPEIVEQLRHARAHGQPRAARKLQAAFARDTPPRCAALRSAIAAR